MLINTLTFICVETMNILPYFVLVQKFRTALIE